MSAARYDYHHRRARQHELFALSSSNAQVQLSHRQLARAYWAAARFLHTRAPGEKRPA